MIGHSAVNTTAVVLFRKYFRGDLFRHRAWEHRLVGYQTTQNHESNLKMYISMLRGKRSFLLLLLFFFF